MTTWNTKCGIAEYSRYLKKAFDKRKDIETTILGSVNYGDYKLREHEDSVYPAFEVETWSGYNGLLVDQILDLDFDILHIQYEVVLYNQQLLGELVSKFPGPTAITFHDNCIPAFPFQIFNLGFAHRENIGAQGPRKRITLPFGIENHSPVVKTFGLGRSRWDVIEDICNIHGYKFEKSFGTEHGWKTQEELHSWLRDSDAIVLFYDEVPSAGSSQAARTAIATRRPVIVNYTTWFEDLPSATKSLKKVKDVKELEYELSRLFTDNYIDHCSWDRIAAMHVEEYKECLSL